MTNLSPTIESLKIEIDWFEKKLKEVEREKIMLRSDLARAIGRMQGLGHPDTYLEKKYPELSHLKGGEEKER